MASLEREIIAHDPQLERVTRPVALTVVVFGPVVIAAFPGALVGALLMLLLIRLAPVHVAVRWVAACIFAGTAWVARGMLIPFWPLRLAVPHESWATALHLNGLPAHTNILPAICIEVLIGPLALQASVVAYRSLWQGISGQLRRQRTLAIRQSGAADSNLGDARPDFYDGVRGVIRLGVDAQSRRPFDLTPEELSQHVFIPGASGSGKTTTLTRLADGALSLGYSVTIIDCKGGRLKKTAVALAKAHGVKLRLVDVDDPATLGYDVCAGSPSEVQNKLSGAFTYGDRAEVYKNQVQRVLPIIAKALIASKQQVSLDNIMDALTPAGMRRLGRAAGEPFADQLDEMADEHGIVEEAHVGLRARLGALIEGKFGPLFPKTENRPFLNWDVALAEPSVIFIALRATEASEDVALLGRVILMDLGQACARRFDAVGDIPAVKPAMVIIDEFAALREPEQVSRLLLQARDGGMSMVLSTQYIPAALEIRSPSLQSALLLCHRVDSVNAETMAAEFSTRKVWEQSIQHHHEEGPTGLGSLRQQDTYRMHPNVLRRLRTGRIAVRSAVDDRIAVVQVRPRDISLS